jgi:hypothetical protein
VGELAGVASAHHDHIIVLVGSTGEFYAFTDPDDRLYSIGQTFGEAMERLLLGFEYGSPIRDTPNPSIERTSLSWLRQPKAAASASCCCVRCQRCANEPRPNQSFERTPSAAAELQR